MSGIGEQRDRVGHDAERDLQHHQRNVERRYDRECKAEVLGRVTVPVVVSMAVPVIMRMLRMMVLTMMVFGVMMFAMLVVIVLIVAMIVLVRGHAQP
jgi:lipopolysaccharide export LptBFGC system permease protein LptF